MRRIIALLLGLLSATLVVAQGGGATETQSLVFTHVTVIDVRNGRAKLDMAVVIRGNRIVAVGESSKTRVPKGSRVIEARGKFLIPGLWDMHAHIGDEDFDRTAHLALFVANGVTGMRVMRGVPQHHQWRKEIESGVLLGPRMVIASQEIDEAKTSASEAREAVRKAKREGADFFKVHDNLSRDSYFALMDEARQLGLRVEGHVPASVTAREASDAGQRSIEHLTGLDEAKSDAVKAAELIAVFKRNGTWHCPTINMRNNYATLDDARLADDPRLKYVKPSWRNWWLKMTRDAAGMPAAEWSTRRELIRKEKALVLRMQRAGVRILAGTDDANPYSFPGFSLHDELAILVDAGLTPLEALQTATHNPAKFLGRLDSLGTVERGKLADLVLLDANPLEDISSTRRINAVVVNGRYFAKETLQKILAEVEAAAAKKSGGR